MRIYLGAQKNYDYAVSVIIPLYNAEEYIAECLDSLLIQTMQDFEVIVVDDCSTDSSVAIVESYAKKFGRRLRLAKTEKNSGSGGYVPRNIGINLACGRYIQFLDADDFLLGTALETLYDMATKHGVDVVYTSSYYRVIAPNEISLHRDAFSEKLFIKNKPVKTFFKFKSPQDNLNRLLLMLGEGNFYSCWSKFIRRDFLLENKIFFPHLTNAGDFIFVINLYCHAKRYVLIPKAFYFYRYYNNSIMRKMRPHKEQILFWSSAFVDFFKALYKLEIENEVLTKNPGYCFAALDKQFNWCLNRTAEARNELANEEIYKILHEEPVKDSDSAKALIPFFFSFIDSERKLRLYYSDIVNKFRQHLTARLDIKYTPESAGECKIISVSDSKASTSKPEWLQKGGTGYLIQSCIGNLETIAKITANGKLTLKLRGVSAYESENKSKRIPYWIDYTKFTINNKVIFDKISPAWHDKPYLHNMTVKAGDEIKIQLEWLPHNSDSKKNTDEQKKLITKSGK